MSLVAVDHVLAARLQQRGLGHWNTLSGQHRLVHDDGTREEDSVAEELTTMIRHYYHITRDQLRRQYLDQSS